MKSTKSWRIAALMGLALSLVGLGNNAWADEEYGGPQEGQVYITPGLSFMSAPDGLGIEDEQIGPAGIIGFPLTNRLVAEVMYGEYDFDYRVGGQSGSDTTDALWANLLYKFTPARGPWQPFLLVGAGRTEFNFDDVADEIDDTQANIGLGVFGQLSPRFSLRADLRGVHSEEEGSLEPFMFVGLTTILGAVNTAAPTDTDGDGVPDRKDKCPNTAPGRDVGADGCELDSDGDGVVDGDDQCPNTPAGTEVNERGCPPDADSDGDGVADSDDRCPNTPAGVSVDSSGCPLDSDGDGVPDFKDQCPDTDAGAVVDETGCYVTLQEAVTIDMTIEFDTNSADIRSSEVPEIRDAVKFLKQYPTSNAVIEGHTDSSGAEAYNQQLSERRARAVMDYMVSQEGIAARRLTSVGYGESRPISSNDDAEGRQRNRRVSAVVSASRQVRATQ
ncbi:MAG: OmpA family protein [Pseudomonadales bacterium]